MQAEFSSLALANPMISRGGNCRLPLWFGENQVFRFPNNITSALYYLIVSFSVTWLIESLNSSSWSWYRSSPCLWSVENNVLMFCLHFLAVIHAGWPFVAGLWEEPLPFFSIRYLSILIELALYAWERWPVGRSTLSSCRVPKLSSQHPQTHHIDKVKFTSLFPLDCLVAMLRRTSKAKY